MPTTFEMGGECMLRLGRRLHHTPQVKSLERRPNLDPEGAIALAIAHQAQILEPMGHRPAIGTIEIKNGMGLAIVADRPSGDDRLAELKIARFCNGHINSINSP